MPVYSVSQVTRYLKDSLEADALLGDLWVRGEVSNLSHSAAGHFYFTLKDATNQMRCVMFRPAHGGENLANGGAIAAHGRVSLYEVRGDIQLYVNLVQPEGVGERHLEMERLKVKLETEGLFEVSRKRHLPAFPRRIGVVTSPFGSVWHDIRNIIQRRFPLVELSLAPTPVQGDGAALGIVEAFEAMNLEHDLDVVILARGGGSLEELSPFNEEPVARAVYSSMAPVVSAVGHETDFTLVDMVSDLRAPTPSAAAELVVPRKEDLEERIFLHRRSLFRQVSSGLVARSQELGQAVWRIDRCSPDVSSWRQKVDDLSHSYGRLLESYLVVRAERIKALESRLASLSPSGVLDRGYAMVHRQDNASLVSSVGQVNVGDNLQVSVKDGSFPARASSRNL